MWGGGVCVLCFPTLFGSTGPTDFCAHQMLFTNAVTHKQMQHYTQNVPGFTNGIGTNLCFQSKCYNRTDCT